MLKELAKDDNHELEGALGFPLFTEGENRLGWLMNLNAVRSLFTQYKNLMALPYIGMLEEAFPVLLQAECVCQDDSLLENACFKGISSG